MQQQYSTVVQVRESYSYFSACRRLLFLQSASPLPILTCAGCSATALSCQLILVYIAALQIGRSSSEPRRVMIVLSHATKQHLAARRFSWHVCPLHAPQTKGKGKGKGKGKANGGKGAGRDDDDLDAIMAELDVGSGVSKSTVRCTHDCCCLARRTVRIVRSAPATFADCDKHRASLPLCAVQSVSNILPPEYTSTRERH